MPETVTNERRATLHRTQRVLGAVAFALMTSAAGAVTSACNVAFDPDSVTPTCPRERCGNIPDDRVSNDLVALYVFDEGAGRTVADVSGVSPQADLTLDAGVDWIPTGGIRFANPGLVAHSDPAEAAKMRDAVLASDEFSLEIWCSPANDTQVGPARIIGYTRDTGEQNTMIGQEAGSFEVRVAVVGSSARETIGPAILPGETMHLVLTYKRDDLLRFYINGVKVHEAAASGDLGVWANGHRFVVGNETTRDRDFLGDVFLVAYYARELDQSGVTRNFGAGF